MIILDASALIALIKQERGYKVIENLLFEAEEKKLSVFIHQINFAEFMYFCRNTYNTETVNGIISDFSSPFIGIMNYMDNDISCLASFLKSKYDISLADAFGLAFSRIIDGTFWTADKELKQIAQNEQISVKIFR